MLLSTGHFLCLLCLAPIGPLIVFCFYLVLPVDFFERPSTLQSVEMESDLENSCTSDLSPNTVLPQRHCSNIERRNTNGKLLRKDDILRVKEGFTEISFCRCRGSSCRNVPSRPVGLEGNTELKRGSIYQSSREVRKMKKMGSSEGRRRVELLRDGNTSFSFKVVDSLCSLDEENTQKRSAAMSAELSLNPESVQMLCRNPSGGFIEICPNLGYREQQSVMSDSKENSNFRCKHVVGPLNDGNNLLERDAVLTFHRSLSAKAEMAHSPSTSESGFSVGVGSKSRFNPIRKMFDPFMKSKSLRSPLGYTVEPGDVKMTGMANMRNQGFRKSLLQDFSHTSQKSDLDFQLVNKDHHHSTIACSPVHLHGFLKLEHKHGVPFFEFSLNSTEEVYVAKMWKATNAFNWVYTFHSISGRKRSNASAWRLTDSNKESLAVGQMQVSSYLCSELKDGGVFNNCMVTEFVLYDIVHARYGVSAQDSSDVVKPSNGSIPASVGGTCGVDNTTDMGKLKHLPKHASDVGIFDSSNPYPWVSAVLRPDLEIAAIVIQLPFAKRESLKCRRADKSSDRTHSNALNLPVVEETRNGRHDSESTEMVKVVIPTGNHGLPTGESQGPGSLLDRWRLGGGCDCGGWDMACPLTVFGNQTIQCDEDQPLVDHRRPLELFVQGTKENIPALTLRVVEDGRYAVDFHAQLSTLQAFSICVAVLHSTEAGEERSKQLPHSNSLKVKFLIGAATEEKSKVSKKMQESQQSYVIEPPFSPIARV